MESRNLYAVKTEDKFHLSDARPRTDIGPQGDHVTAYGLFKEQIRSLGKDDPYKELYRLVYIISNINDLYKKYIGEDEESFDERIDLIFTSLQEAKETFLNNDKITKIISFIPDPMLQKEAQRALEGFNRMKFNEMINFLSNEYLDMKNHQKYASFPQEGNEMPLPGEASRVKEAVKNLRIFDENLEKTQHLSSADTDKLTQWIFNLFWYPKISKEKLIGPGTDKKGEKKWEKAAKKYKKGTIPRNNSFDILCFVTAVHIDTLCFCFANFNKIKNQIIKAFVLKIAKDWEMDPKATEAFLKMIKEKYFMEEIGSSLELSIEEPSKNIYGQLEADSSTDTPPSQRTSGDSYFNPDTPTSSDFNESLKSLSPKRSSMLFSPDSLELSPVSPVIKKAVAQGGTVNIPAQDTKTVKKSGIPIRKGSTLAFSGKAKGVSTTPLSGVKEEEEKSAVKTKKKNPSDKKT